jgi:hypothetical protein
MPKPKRRKAATMWKAKKERSSPEWGQACWKADEMPLLLDELEHDRPIGKPGLLDSLI